MIDMNVSLMMMITITIFDRYDDYDDDDDDDDDWIERDNFLPTAGCCFSCVLMTIAKMVIQNA